MAANPQRIVEISRSIPRGPKLSATIRYLTVPQVGLHGKVVEAGAKSGGLKFGGWRFEGGRTHTHARTHGITHAQHRVQRLTCGLRGGVC